MQNYPNIGNTIAHAQHVLVSRDDVFLVQMTRHYELLNYSEHGTTVDNVLYSCDFSDKVSGALCGSAGGAGPGPGGSGGVAGAVRKLIGGSGRTSASGTTTGGSCCFEQGLSFCASICFLILLDVARERLQNSAFSIRT